MSDFSRRGGRPLPRIPPLSLALPDSEGGPHAYIFSGEARSRCAGQLPFSLCSFLSVSYRSRSYNVKLCGTMITTVMGKHVAIGLTLALVIGVVTNIWQLDRIPPGLHADEAMIGYTTLSLLQTGKDLLGETNYLALSDPNAGGTYPPLRSYILMPFVKFFGLSVFVNRLPPALFGVILIFLMFRIAKLLLKDDRMAVVTALITAINPWATQMARQALLESGALTLTTAAILLFLEGAKKPRLYLWSGLFFGLSLFAYDAPRLFVPIFLGVLCWFQWSDIRKHFRPALIGFTVFVIFFGAFLYQLIYRGEIREYTRSGAANSTNVTGTVIRGRTLTQAPEWASKLVHNKVTATARTLVTNYVSIFSINWFFVNGYGNLQEAVGNHGQYHFFELPLFFLGWIYLFRKTKKIAWIILSWLLIGALPGGISSGNFAYRSVLMLPAPILVTSAGLIVFLENIRMIQIRSLQVAIRIVGVLLISINIGSYLYTYFFEYPIYASENWAKQQNDAIRYAVSQKEKYKYVIFDGGLSWAAMYGFMYRLDTAQFQHIIKQPVTVGGSEYLQFDTFLFRDFTDDLRLLSTASESFPKGSLIITAGGDDVFKNDVPIEKFLAPGDSHAVYKAIVVQ